MQCLLNDFNLTTSCLASIASYKRAGCSVDIPANWVTLEPEHIQASSETSTRADWLMYVRENPQLEHLIEQAIVSNKDLAIAAARVALAHAELKRVQPKRLPTIQASFAGTRQKLNAFGPTLINAPAYDNYSASLGLRWEIDLWGSLKNQVQSQRALLESSQANLRYAQMSDCLAGCQNLARHHSLGRSI